MAVVDCQECGGTGSIVATFHHGTQEQDCLSCEGTGTILVGVLSESLSSEEAAFWRRDCERREPHPPHQVEHLVHEIGREFCHNSTHQTWCYGIVDPASLRGQVERLEPGQKVRVVLEGVVEEPRHFNSKVEWPAVSIRSCDDTVVLRYTGGHPASTHDPEAVRGLLVGPLVSVEVVPDG